MSISDLGSRNPIISGIAGIGIGFTAGYFLTQAKTSADRDAINAALQQQSKIVTSQTAQITKQSNEAIERDHLIETLRHNVAERINKDLYDAVLHKEEISRLENVQLKKMINDLTRPYQKLPTPKFIVSGIMDPMKWCPWDEHGPCFELVDRGSFGNTNFHVSVASEVWGRDSIVEFSNNTPEHRFLFGKEQYSISI